MGRHVVANTEFLVAEGIFMQSSKHFVAVLLQIIEATVRSKRI